jgi:hypothetical protein
VSSVLDYPAHLVSPFFSAKWRVRWRLESGKAALKPPVFLRNEEDWLPGEAS